MSTQDDGILKAIALIDQKIQTLQGLREQLINEFGLKNGNRSSADLLPNPQERPNFQITETKFPLTRKQQVVELIRQTGPLRRSEIIKKSGLPVGTISYCLNDESLFKSLRDGRWDLVARDSA